MSISVQTHEFIINAMRQRRRADNLTIWYCKKQIDVLSCYWEWVSSYHCQSSLRIHSAIASWIHNNFDNVMTKFMINNRTDTWKTDVKRPVIDHEFRHNIVKLPWQCYDENPALSITWQTHEKLTSICFWTEWIHAIWTVHLRQREVFNNHFYFLNFCF